MPLKPGEVGRGDVQAQAMTSALEDLVAARLAVDAVSTVATHQGELIASTAAKLFD
jgi:hypothetical protein